jgi:prephenate dehydrogenase
VIDMRVAVIGIGLIGGSVALAARERLGAHVSGWDFDPAALSRARAAGVIDTSARSIEAAVDDAEAVVVAAPVEALPDLVAAVLSQAPADCLVTDVGSTKRTIVAAIADPRFVGGHPLAGAETSGVEHARADLLAGATWYLTASEQTSAASLARARSLVSGLGATPVEIGADTHDRAMACVSQLPHIFADVLVSQAAALSGKPALGPSFRDATRVAGSNTAIWGDIYMDNRDLLAAAVGDAITALTSVRDKLEAGDRDALERWSRQAAADRAQLSDRTAER